MEGWQGRVFWRLSAASLSLMLMLRLAEKKLQARQGFTAKASPVPQAGWAGLGWVGLRRAGYRQVKVQGGSLTGS